LLIKRAAPAALFCIPPAPVPSHVRKDSVPEHLKDVYKNDINDLTPEVIKNLDFLGIDYLVPIGGDDTLSYGVRLCFRKGLK